MTPRVVDLFCGPRGWECGMARVDVDLMLDTIGIDHAMPECRTSIAAGLPVIRGDVSDYPLERFAGVEGIIASPPCPAFSTAGKQEGVADIPRLLEYATVGPGRKPISRDRWAHPESRLSLEPLRWALALRPTWLCWEQVRSILPLWAACATTLRRKGWNVWYGVLDAECYGVPQTRNRAVLIASQAHPVGEPTPTHQSWEAHKRHRDRLASGQTSMFDGIGLPAPLSMSDALGWGTDGYVRGDRGAGMIERYGDRPDRPADAPAPTVTAGESRYSGGPRWEIDRGRPAHTITGGGTGGGGGPEPFASPEARRAIACLRNGAQANAAEREPDEPAPTILASADNGDTRWQVNRRTNSRGPAGTVVETVAVPVDAPSPTVTGKAGTQWIWEERPATTVVGTFRPDVIAAPNHHDGPRQEAEGSVAVSEWELARLQDFPDGWPFQGNKSERHRQIGNAVPAGLAAAVLAEALHSESSQDAETPSHSGPTETPSGGEMT